MSDTLQTQNVVICTFSLFIFIDLYLSMLASLTGMETQKNMEGRMSELLLICITDQRKLTLVSYIVIAYSLFLNTTEPKLGTPALLPDIYFPDYFLGSYFTLQHWQVSRIAGLAFFVTCIASVCSGFRILQPFPNKLDPALS